MENTKGMDILKRLAISARKKMNGSIKVNSESSKKIEQCIANKKLYNHEYIMKPLVDENVSLTSKIVSLLSRNADNPKILADLVDKTTYENLDDEGKLRYMLTLSEKYLEIREREARTRQIEAEPSMCM